MFVSSTTPLAANANVILGPYETFRAQNITGSVFSDVAGILYIEQSLDRINWDVSTSYPISAGNGSGFTEPVVGTYFRVKYVNGATPQATFRLFGRTFQSGAT